MKDLMMISRRALTTASKVMCCCVEARAKPAQRWKRYCIEEVSVPMAKFLTRRLYSV